MLNLAVTNKFLFYKTKKNVGNRLATSFEVLKLVDAHIWSVISQRLMLTWFLNTGHRIKI